MYIFHMYYQDLSNVLLACSRVATPEALEGQGLREALRGQVFGETGKRAPFNPSTTFRYIYPLCDPVSVLSGI